MTRKARPSPANPAPDPPDEAALRAAAIKHLARFSATEAGLARVLNRRIDRWQRAAEQIPASDRQAASAAAGDTASCAQQARRLIPPLIQHFVAQGAISDTQFAQDRARALTRAGKSRRAVAAWLAQRGVDAPAIDAALPDGTEFTAALVHARKRRIGPWRKLSLTPEALRRELGNMARAGFAQDVARRALAAPLAEAEAAIAASRHLGD